LDFAEVIFSGSPKVCILTRIALLNIWGKGHGKKEGHGNERKRRDIRQRKRKIYKLIKGEKRAAPNEQ